MTPKSQLRVERLEIRSTPAVFGTPWLDGMHLTLSFAPDGADVSGAASNLDQVLSQLGTTNARLAILKAFQTWAASANLNLGLVADNGDSFSAVGAVQTDDRFGDIRIGARSLGSDVLAITAPFNLFNSFSGDVVINSDQPFTATGQSDAYDLFTALLQEAGHAFGVGNSPDQTSVMYEDYLEPRRDCLPPTSLRFSRYTEREIPTSLRASPATTPKPTRPGMPMPSKRTFRARPTSTTTDSRCRRVRSEARLISAPKA